VLLDAGVLRRDRGGRLHRAGLSMARRVFVAGHRGMVGSAIVRQLAACSDVHLVTRTHDQLDLANQAGVNALFAAEHIDEVYLAAAKVGGIQANNTLPADFIYDNLAVQCNVIHAAHMHGVQRLLFLGSSCIYPREAAQPMREEALLTGKLEPTNEPYAIAKIAGIKMCESYNRQYGRDYRAVMPTNLYGPGDNYHPEHGHVIPALLRRFHEAKQQGSPEVVIWGTGAPRREFLFVDDMAAACVHVMGLPRAVYDGLTRPQQGHVNVGYGEDVAIADLARIIAGVVGYAGRIVFDDTKPDGAPRKLMDSGRLNGLGWHPGVALDDGLRIAYEDFLGGNVRR